MKEADIKRAMVQSMKDAGSYGRRIEDQYAVGTYDLILIPFGLPVFMAEVKMIKDNTFGPTLRQFVELERIKHVGFGAQHVIPVMIGWKNDVYYFSAPKMNIARNECFSVTTTHKTFHDQLVLYYHSMKGAK
jgi:hypothetical protein